MQELFKIAERENIDVEYTRLPELKSFSASQNNLDFILLDYSLIERGASERVHAYHELGHCMTGSFYNLYSPFDIRTKHEARADRWAIRRLVPYSELKQLLERYDDIAEWQLAERFDVTPYGEVLKQGSYILMAERTIKQVLG